MYRKIRKRYIHEAECITFQIFLTRKMNKGSTILLFFVLVAFAIVQAIQSSFVNAGIDHGVERPRFPVKKVRKRTNRTEL